MPTARVDDEWTGLAEGVESPMDISKVLISPIGGAHIDGLVRWKERRAPSATQDIIRAPMDRRSEGEHRTSKKNRDYHLDVLGHELGEDNIYVNCRDDAEGRSRLRLLLEGDAMECMDIVNAKRIGNLKKFVLDNAWPTVALAAVPGGAGVTWANDATARPKKDARAILELVRKQSYGKPFDTLVIHRLIVNELIGNGELNGLFVAPISGGGNAVEGVRRMTDLTDDDILRELARIFKISPDRVSVADGRHDTANPAKNQVIGEIWGDTPFMWLARTTAITAPIADNSGIYVRGGAIAGMWAECLPPQAKQYETNDGLRTYAAIDHVGGAVTCDLNSALLVTDVL